MKRRTCAAFLLALSCACGQDAFDKIVRSRGDRFMGVVLVARGGEVLFHKAYGHANLEWDIPNTPEAKFRLGSVTKQFTAASILLLEERAAHSHSRKRATATRNGFSPTARATAPRA